MAGWIVIGALYVFGVGFFRWLGGVASASDAIAQWGRATAEKRRRSLAPPSSSPSSPSSPRS